MLSYSVLLHMELCILYLHYCGHVTVSLPFHAYRVLTGRSSKSDYGTVGTCISLTVVRWWWCLNAPTTTVCAWTALQPTAPQSWMIDNLWRMTKWGSPFPAQVRHNETSASHVRMHVHIHNTRIYTHTRTTYVRTCAVKHTTMRSSTHILLTSATNCFPFYSSQPWPVCCDGYTPLQNHGRQASEFCTHHTYVIV